MNARELFPGAPISISLEIDNSSKKSISRVDVSLCGHIWARARGHTRGSRLWGAKIGSKELEKEFGLSLPIKSGESRNCEATFTVPGKLGPTVHMPQGQVNWVVAVSVRYGLKSCSIQVPVLLQPHTPFYLQDFPVVPIWSTVHKSQVEMHAENRQVDIPWWACLE